MLPRDWLECLCYLAVVDPGAGLLWGDRMHDTAGGLAISNAVWMGLQYKRSKRWEMEQRSLRQAKTRRRQCRRASECETERDREWKRAIRSSSMGGRVCGGLKLNAVWTRWQSPVALLHAVPHCTLGSPDQCLVIAHHDDRPVPSQSIGTSRPPASSDCCDLQAERPSNPHCSSAPRPRLWRQLVYVRILQLA